MKKVATLFALLAFSLMAQNALAQGKSLNSTTVCFSEDHPTAYTDLTYKTNAPSVKSGNNPPTQNLKIRIYRPADLPAG